MRRRRFSAGARSVVGMEVGPQRSRSMHKPVKSHASVMLSNARRQCRRSALPAAQARQEHFQHGYGFMDQDQIAALDAVMMARCIALSKTAGQEVEFPFACVIADK